MHLTPGRVRERDIIYDRVFLLFHDVALLLISLGLFMEYDGNGNGI